MTPETEQQLQNAINNLEKLLMTKIGALEKITEERFASHAMALKIQAAEYERRLDALNGEAARLREVYESNHREIYKKVEGLITREGKAEGRSEGKTAAWLILVVIINFFISAIGIIMAAVK